MTTRPPDPERDEDRLIHLRVGERESGPPWIKARLLARMADLTDESLDGLLAEFIAQVRASLRAHRSLDGLQREIARARERIREEG